jgi:hypothetical protein
MDRLNRSFQQTDSLPSAIGMLTKTAVQHSIAIAGSSIQHPLLRAGAHDVSPASRMVSQTRQ